MIQGTTPTHVFTVPIDTEIIDKLSITYAQNGVVILKKDKEDCTIEANTITVKLTQEETLKFSENASVQIQMKVLLVDGNVLVGSIHREKVNEVLDKVVL